jgi:hypothetical protein
MAHILFYGQNLEIQVPSIFPATPEPELGPAFGLRWQRERHIFAAWQAHLDTFAKRQVHDR